MDLDEKKCMYIGGCCLSRIWCWSKYNQDLADLSMFNGLGCIEKRGLLGVGRGEWRNKIRGNICLFHTVSEHPTCQSPTFSHYLLIINNKCWSFVPFLLCLAKICLFFLTCISRLDESLCEIQTLKNPPLFISKQIQVPETPIKLNLISQ